MVSPNPGPGFYSCTKIGGQTICSQQFVHTFKHYRLAIMKNEGPGHLHPASLKFGHDGKLLKGVGRTRAKFPANPFIR